MSEHRPDREALETAHDLTGSMDGLTAELARLNRYGRTNRHLIWVTAASIVLDVVVTVLLVFAYGTARDAHEISTAQHSNLLASCRLGNQTRAEEVTLWTHLGSISKAPVTDTPAQAARERRKVAALLAYIGHVFAPRDCTSLYHLP